MYVGIWVIMILLYLCLAFTSINMNVVQARNLLSNIKSEVSASNGAILGNNIEYTFKSKDKGITIKDNGYSFEYKITKQSLYNGVDGQPVYDDATKDSTFIYNNMYKIELKYRYTVPLFGIQVYPISTLAY